MMHRFLVDEEPAGHFTQFAGSQPEQALGGTPTCVVLSVLSASRRPLPFCWRGWLGMEYRGYDSAGLALLDPVKGLQVAKAKGRLSVLSEKVDGGKKLFGTIGVGHTRWATHGEPSDVNSHPHVSESGRIAVVHNGIIENYMEIKEFLQAEGRPVPLGYGHGGGGAAAGVLLSGGHPGRRAARCSTASRAPTAWASSAPSIPNSSSPPERTAL